MTSAPSITPSIAPRPTPSPTVCLDELCHTVEPTTSAPTGSSLSVILILVVSEASRRRRLASFASMWCNDFTSLDMELYVRQAIAAVANTSIESVGTVSCANATLNGSTAELAAACRLPASRWLDRGAGDSADTVATRFNALFVESNTSFVTELQRVVLSANATSDELAWTDSMEVVSASTTLSVTFEPSLSPSTWQAALPLRPTQLPTLMSPPSSSPTWDATSSIPTLASCDRIDVPAAPRLEAASFDSTGALVTASFSDSTDQASLAVGAAFACSTVLSFTGHDDVECTWVTSDSLVIAASSAVDLRVASSLTLREGVLKRECGDGRCDCDVFASESTVRISAPAQPASPSVVLKGPTTAGICSGFDVDALESSGGGGRPLTYEWSLAPANESIVDDDGALDAALDRALGSAFLALTPTELQSLYGAGVRLLVVQLRLTNFLGGSASGDLDIRLVDVLVPTVEIIGGLVQTIRRPDALAVKTEALATSCDGRSLADRGVAHAYSLVELDSGQPTNLTSVSRDARFYALPAYSLDAGLSYTLTVAIFDVQTGASASSTCEIQVVRSDVVALIGGGSSRVVSIQDSPEISASKSYDEDVEGLFGSAAGLRFAWGCTRVATQEDCSGGLSNRSAETVVLDVVHLGVGVVVLSVNTTADDNRSATSMTTLEIVNDEPPRVAIERQSAVRVPVSTRLVAFGTVSPPESSSSSSISSTWSLQSGTLVGNVALGDVATTSIELTTQGNTSLVHALVLPSGFLVGGATYEFRLEARFVDDDAAGAATISVKVAFPPTAGTLAVSPEAGVSLETMFALVARDWSSAELPLQYAFFVLDDATAERSTLRTATLEPNFEDALLPPGDPNVTVMVVATDQLGGQANASQSVETRATELAGRELANLTVSLLEVAAALGSPESVCQVVVSAASIARNNTDVLGVIVNALQVVVNGGDLSDVDRVEQRAAALASVAGQDLATDTSLQLLDMVESLTDASSGIGVTDASASAMVSVMSNLLDDDDLFQRSNTTDALFASLGDLLRAQLVGRVVDEAAVTLESTNLRTAAALVRDDGVVSIPASGTGVQVPASGSHEWAIQLSELSTNPYGSSSRDITSPLLRVGVFDWSSGRRRLQDLPQVELFFAQVDDDYSEASSNATANLTCDCGFDGVVSHVCPANEATISLACDPNAPGVYSVGCPRTSRSCNAWNGSDWESSACRVTSTTSGSVACTCDLATAATFSVSTSLSDSYAAYATTLAEEVDPERALFMFIMLGLVVVVCCGLAQLGNSLDHRHSTLLDGPPKPFITAFGTLTLLHGRNHIEQTRHRGDSKKLNKSGQGNVHPLFLSKQHRLRFMLALCHQHPFANWYFCYSPKVPRALRVLTLLWEVLFFMFALACEGTPRHVTI